MSEWQTIEGVLVSVDCDLGPRDLLHIENDDGKVVHVWPDECGGMESPSGEWDDHVGKRLRFRWRQESSVEILGE